MTSASGTPSSTHTAVATSPVPSESASADERLGRGDVGPERRPVHAPDERDERQHEQREPEHRGDEQDLRDEPRPRSHGVPNPRPASTSWPGVAQDELGEGLAPPPGSRSPSARRSGSD